jgi:hypothetical protein
MSPRSVVAAAAQRLATMDYEVPAQDLSIDPSRMPAIPASRLRLELRG